LSKPRRRLGPLHRCCAATAAPRLSCDCATTVTRLAADLLRISASLSAPPQYTAVHGGTQQYTGSVHGGIQQHTAAPSAITTAMAAAPQGLCSRGSAAVVRARCAGAKHPPPRPHRGFMTRARPRPDHNEVEGLGSARCGAVHRDRHAATTGGPGVACGGSAAAPQPWEATPALEKRQMGAEGHHRPQLLPPWSWEVVQGRAAAGQGPDATPGCSPWCSPWCSHPQQPVRRIVAQRRCRFCRLQRRPASRCGAATSKTLGRAPSVPFLAGLGGGEGMQQGWRS
jgi:hypothetical protein